MNNEDNVQSTEFLAAMLTGIGLGIVTMIIVVCAIVSSIYIGEKMDLKNFIKNNKEACDELSKRIKNAKMGEKIKQLEEKIKATINKLPGFTVDDPYIIDYTDKDVEKILIKRITMIKGDKSLYKKVLKKFTMSLNPIDFTIDKTQSGKYFTGLTKKIIEDAIEGDYSQTINQYVDCKKLMKYYQTTVLDNVNNKFDNYEAVIENFEPRDCIIDRDNTSNIQIVIYNANNVYINFWDELGLDEISDMIVKKSRENLDYTESVEAASIFLA